MKIAKWEGGPMSDEYIDEMNAVRRQMLDECGGDIQGLGKLIKRSQEEDPENLVDIGTPKDVQKPVILLYDLFGLGLIIPWPSGVVYQGQVGGHYCLPFREEGVFVPLETERFEESKALEDYFTGPKWGGWCGEGVDEETAAFIDRTLARLRFDEEFVKVDRARLHESVEAWVYVDVPKDLHFDGLTPCKAILTWQNSD